MPRFAVILPAAGRSTRFGDPKQKKIYADLDGRAVWLRAVEPFVNRDDVGQILLAIAPEDRELFERRYRPNVAFLNIQVLEGGAERADSIANALERGGPVVRLRRGPRRGPPLLDERSGRRRLLGGD